MKHIQKNKIINISYDTPNVFMFEYLKDITSDIKVIDMAKELEKYKNNDLFGASE